MNIDDLYPGDRIALVITRSKIDEVCGILKVRNTPPVRRYEKEDFMFLVDAVKKTA